MRQVPSAKASRLLVPTVLLLALSLSGCQAFNYIAYLITPASKGEWIPAECEALTEGKKVLILVYADENIQYRHDALARYNTAMAVAEEMQDKLKVDIVDTYAVEHFQANNTNWTSMHPAKVGQRFHSEFVLYIELQQFTTQAEESGELLRGRLEASNSLYTVSQRDDQEVEQLWQDKIRTVYPPDRPEVADTGAADRVRRETYRLFAEALVKRFYGHHEPY